MAYLAQESFNIPPGFAVEEIKGQLYYDDLEEDDELWLIRMPCDVELSALDRRKIFLSDDVGGISIKKFETENGKSLECFSETCEISSTSVVLPKRQDGQLHAVKKGIKGAILISEGLCLDNEVEIKSEKEDGHLDSFSVTEESNKEKTVKRKKKIHCDLNTNESLVKCENVDEHSEASNNSICKKRKRKKKTHSDLNTDESEVNYENANEHSEDSNNSTCKKRKKSKKNKHSHNDFNTDDLNYETEAAESFSSPTSKKKSSKKNSNLHRKSNERLKIKIKDEPMSVDFDDGFPTCNSQK